MKKMIIGFAIFALLNTSVHAQEVVIIKKNSKETTDKPLMVIDGVITMNADMDQYAPNDIKSVSVLKGEMATKKYGDKGAKGVIEIISKKKGDALRDVVKVTGTKIIIDTIVNNKNNNTDTTIHKNINEHTNLSIVVDGDKITINGKPADKNDPRLKMNGKTKMIKIEKNKKSPDHIIIENYSEEAERKDGDDRNDRNEMGSDDVLDMLTAPAPPTNKAFLGVITEATENGARINTVSEESPAKQAGLKEGDIITKVNDKKIDGPQALYEAVGSFKPADKITISYTRDGKEQKVTAALAKNKATEAPRAFSFAVPNGKMPNNMRRGFKISPDQNFNFELPELKELDGLMNQKSKKPKLGISVEDIESGTGVKIKSVTAGSPAEKAGLKINDIITEYENNKVTDVNDLKWNYLQEGQVLKFVIQRNGLLKEVEVKIPKKLKTADL
jgi:serine protease Do